MFGLLRKKIRKVVDDISEKIGKEQTEKDTGDGRNKAPYSDLENPPAPDKLKEDIPELPEKLRIKTELKPPMPQKTEKKEEKGGIFSALTKSITKKKLSGEFLDDVLWELEIALLENNVAVEVTEKIKEDIKNHLMDKSVGRAQAKEIIEKTMEKTIRDILGQEKTDIKKIIKDRKKNKEPALFLFIGFNGSGKTTSVAKLAKFLQKKNYSVVLAAADTFRAAAIEQLERHGDNLGITVVKQSYGSDPAAVIFDAMKHAKAKGIDVVLADTAGRVHTDKNLIYELKKIVKVNKPDLSILTVESMAGNDVVEQARIFNEAGIDCVILSKWDVDKKGGSALSLTYTLKKPILFLGTGQDYNDFKEFNVDEAIMNII